MADKGDYSKRYNTKLSPKEEKAYQSWVKSEGLGNDPNYDYDMRGYYKQMLHQGSERGSNGHFPDTFKKPNHMTFSDQSQYSGKDGHVGGSWTQLPDKTWLFVASPTNMAQHDTADYQRYFNTVEKGNHLIMNPIVPSLTP